MIQIEQQAMQWKYLDFPYIHMTFYVNNDYYILCPLNIKQFNNALQIF